MNGKQKTVVACGLLLALLSGLFPPWEGWVPVSDYPSFDARLVRRLGRSFLFAPPTSVDAFEAITGKRGRERDPPKEAIEEEVERRLRGYSSAERERFFDEVNREMRRKGLPTVEELSRYRVEILYTEAAFQLLVVILVAAGLTLLLTERKG